MKKFKNKVIRIAGATILALFFASGFLSLHAQNVIEIDEVYTFSQAPSSSVDYQIDLPQPGEYTIHLDNWLSTYNWSLDYDRLYIYNSDNEPVDRNDFSSEEDPFLFHMFQDNTGLVFRVGQTGTYTITVHSGQHMESNWGSATMQNYDLSVTGLYCNDGYEMNDEFSSATPISIGATITAYQWRETNTAEVWGDEDWYKVQVDAPGILSIDLVEWIAIYNWSADYDRLFVYNGDGTSIGQSGGDDFYYAMMGGGTDEEPFVIQMNLTHAGSYYLRFHAGWATSTTPYHFTTSYTAVDDPFEPNDDFSTAKPIPASDVWYQAYEWRSLDSTMNVSNDEDFYYFHAAAAGDYSITLDGWIPIYNWGANYDRMYIFDAAENPVGASPYSWMMGTDPINFSVPSEGLYYIQLHCGSAYSHEGYQFLLSGSIIGVGIEDMASEQFELFPNPASDVVTLNLADAENEALTLRIYSVEGELVRTESLQQNNKKLDVGQFKEGIYIIELESGTVLLKQKLIIQR